MLKQLLHTHSSTNTTPMSEATKFQKIKYGDIAVIGLALDFPCASDPDTFWELLRSGKDAVRKLPYGRMNDASRYITYQNKSDNEQALSHGEAAFLDEIDKFDYKFFRMSPKEASLTDPNHRLFLQTAWKALEEAGYGGNRLKGSRTGVFVGSSSEAVYKNMIAELHASELSMALTGNIHAVLPSRLAYLLDLRGPSLVVDTSCSSSLVAVHLACQSIRNGECDTALVGGIQLHILPIRQTKVGIESSNGRTRTFDDQSDGTGTGEGVGVVLLKPLEAALADRDHIHAVIKGSAINQDGKSMGLTAPNAVAQEEVLIRAWKEAGIDPKNIGYIEAHGTGTKLGDPIEIDGIRRAFARVTDRKQFCAIGSVKSNLGHLDNAAGIAGMIKSILALKYKQIPPTLHVRRANRSIPFEDSPVYINDQLQEWESDNSRLCGVSSFGISGTNCHIVMEEAPIPSLVEETGSPHLFTLSARSITALKRAVSDYAVFTERNPDVLLMSLCYTANTGRHHWEHRLAAVVESMAELSSLLQLASRDWEAACMNGVFYAECTPDDMPARSLVLASQQRAELEQVCAQYVSGSIFEWETSYSGHRAHRITLPTYSFDKSRCWLEIPDTTEQMFYTTRWEKSFSIDHNYAVHGTTLLLHNCSPAAINIVNLLRTQGGRVIEVIIGSRYEMLDDEDRYFIGYTEEDYRKLIEHLQEVQLDRILHATALNPDPTIESVSDLMSEQHSGLYSLFHLVSALSLQISDRPTELIVLTCYGTRTTANQEIVHPLRTALLGLAKVVHWENPQLRCRCIDLDENTDSLHILKEISASQTEFQIAYRGEQRWVERLAHLEIAQATTSEAYIRTNGVYVITGGLGRLGLQMARYLASKTRVHLILLNRTAFSSRSEWDELNKHGGNDEMLRQIQAIREIEATGSHVHMYQVDLTDVDRLNNVLIDVRNQYGSLNGIMHCAGVGVGMMGEMIPNDRLETFEAVIAPKILGTWNIAQATKQDDMDFMILFSSVITLIGAVGSGSYTAANAYLDSFAADARLHGRPVTTINWPYWLKEDEEEEIGNHAKEIFRFLAPEKAFSALDDLLGLPLDRVIIGQLHRQSPVLQLGDHLPLKLSDELLDSFPDTRKAQSVPLSVKRKNVKLKGTKDANVSEVEQFVATTWNEVLGFSELSIDDNFFDLGGDSIMVTKVFSLLQERYADRIRMADLFTYPTISKIAAHLAYRPDEPFNKEQGNIGDGILRLVSELEQGNMTLEQVVEQYQLLEVER